MLAVLAEWRVPMLLVPKQLMRAGMTGNVPYYGGRFTPAQAYAASHPGWRPGPGPTLASGPLVRTPMPEGGPPAPPPPAKDPAYTLQALQNLLDAGVITPEEYERLRSRVGR
jgi:hypothetical protein